VAGLALLDSAILTGRLMARARSGDAEARDLAAALYSEYLAVLDEHPDADPAAPATRAAVQEALDELGALAAAEDGAQPPAGMPVPIPLPGTQAEIRAEAVGPVDGDPATWTPEQLPEGTAVSPDGDAIALRTPASLGEQQVLLRWSKGAAEGWVRLRLIPHAPAADATGAPLEIVFEVVRPDGVVFGGWTLEAGNASAQDHGEVFMVHVPAEAEPQPIHVRFAYEDLEGLFEIMPATAPVPAPPHGVAGTVGDADGNPVPGAEVELREGDAEGRIALSRTGELLHTTTDRDGRFVLPYTRAGTYTLVIRSREGERRIVIDVAELELLELGAEIL
jgi:hypothetical protein